MEHTTSSPLAVRLARQRQAAAWLQNLGDDALAEVLVEALAQPPAKPDAQCTTARAGGLGGSTAQLPWGEQRIFCKLVPLAPLELEAALRGSTANIYNLPLYYQYGIGSLGFGAWREWAAHRLASQWVASGQHSMFPLLFHWRVLPQPAPGAAVYEEAYSYLQHPAAQGQDESAIRRRLDALQASSACLALFTECIPMPLSTWLQQRLLAGPQAADAAVRSVEAAASQALQFMAGQGFVHFDTHLDNILTDGTRLYFADFGLAVHRSFQLSAEERVFLQRHTGYDAARFSSSLVQNLCRAIPGREVWARKLQRLQPTPGCGPGVLPAAALDALRRHAPAAVYMAEFARRLINVNRHQVFDENLT